MARIASQIDRLSGDVSTAVVEAFDAVHLMTVHAAKGLEFPVVFLVDLGRGTGARTPAIQVTPDRGDGQPSVTVWPYRSSADEDERSRNLEETKRLLYVACTRARDRLYLSAVGSEGGVKFNRGSFGEVLPKGFASVFVAAADRSRARIVWEGPDRSVHEFRGADHGDVACVGSATTKQVAEIGATNVKVDLSPAEEMRSIRTTVTESVGAVPDGHREGSVDDEFTRHADLVGRTVHRLLQRFLGLRVEVSTLGGYADELLRQELPLEPDVTTRLGLRAVELYRDLSKQADVVALRHEECLFEAPFSVHNLASVGAGTKILTGAIDCLTQGPDGMVKVLEFKAGIPQPEHQRQLDQYVAVARAMFPGKVVEGRLLYPS